MSMDGNNLIGTLTGGLTAALVFGYISHRLRLSPIVGYLLAGFFVGPNTPGFTANHEVAEQLAEIGVILLMFGVGLQFHIEELMAVRKAAVPGAVGQAVLATLLGTGMAWLAGWSTTAGLVYGLCLSVASTVVLTRVLSDCDELHTPIGKIAIGWLVVEDILAVLVLVVIPTIFGKEQSSGASLAIEILWALCKMACLMAAMLVLGGRIIPWVLQKVAETRSRELFTLSILALALGIAVGSALIFGVSMALGAFLAGMVVGRSDFSVRAATEALPMRDAFAVLFFVSVGMLFDPSILWTAPWLVLEALLIVMVATPLFAGTILLVLGYPLRVAIGLGLALTQIGEFSFIIARLGNSLELIDTTAYQAIIATAMITISANAILYRFVDPVERWLLRHQGVRGLVKKFARESTLMRQLQEIEAANTDPNYRAVIIGYGPVGHTVCRLLRDNGIQPTIIEMNLETIGKLRAQGLAAVYGDANHRETLTQAGLARANSLVLSSSGVRAAAEIIRMAREINPQVRVLARVSYLKERAHLLEMGANKVFSGEGEVALAMTESILKALGATAEQIDRERERLHQDLFRGSPPSTAFLALPRPRKE